MGRSRSAHARSAVSASGGMLRNVSARRRRSPSDSDRPPSRDRNATANSASFSESASIVTPAAARSSRTRSISASTSLPTTSARFAAPSVADVSSAFSRSEKHAVYRTTTSGLPSCLKTITCVSSEGLRPAPQPNVPGFPYSPPAPVPYSPRQSREPPGVSFAQVTLTSVIASSK
jgi:hypothetical protein